MVTEFIPARKLVDTDVIIERNSRGKPTQFKIRRDGVYWKRYCGVHVTIEQGPVWCYQPESVVEVKA